MNDGLSVDAFVHTDLPVGVGGLDRQVVPARAFGGDFFEAAAGAVRVDRFDDLAAAVAAAEDDAQAAGVGARLVLHFPVHAESTAVAGEGLGLFIPSTRPGSERLPDDHGVRRR